MRDMLGRVDFATVRAAQAVPPHSVDKPQRDVAHEKDDDSENRGVSVDDENEIVEVDHLLGLPRAGMRMPWISVWTLSGIHRLYWPAGGINLPRVENAQFFYRSSRGSEKRKEKLMVGCLELQPVGAEESHPRE